jgi:hypothetical protein
VRAFGAVEAKRLFSAPPSPFCDRKNATLSGRPYRSFIFVEFGYGGKKGFNLRHSRLRSDHNQHPFPLSPARRCIRIKAGVLRTWLAAEKIRVSHGRTRPSGAYRWPSLAVLPLRSCPN